MESGTLKTLEKEEYLDILSKSLHQDEETRKAVGKGDRQAWYTDIAEITRLSEYTEKSKLKARLTLAVDMMGDESSLITEDFPYYPKKGLYLCGYTFKKHDKYLTDGLGNLKVGSPRRIALCDVMKELTYLAEAATKAYKAAEKEHEKAEETQKKHEEKLMEEMRKYRVPSQASREEVNSSQLFWMFLVFIGFLAAVYFIF